MSQGMNRVRNVADVATAILKRTLRLAPQRTPFEKKQGVFAYVPVDKGGIPFEQAVTLRGKAIPGIILGSGFPVEQISTEAKQISPEDDLLISYGKFLQARKAWKEGRPWGIADISIGSLSSLLGLVVFGVNITMPLLFSESENLNWTDGFLFGLPLIYLGGSVIFRCTKLMEKYSEIKDLLISELLNTPEALANFSRIDKEAAKDLEDVLIDKKK